MPRSDFETNPGRPEKYLLALRALRTLHSIAPLSPALHLLIIRFITLLPTISESLPPVVLAAINEALPEFYDGSPLESFNSSYLQKGLGAVGAVTVARGMILLRGEAATTEVESLLFSSTKQQLSADLPVRSHSSSLGGPKLTAALQSTLASVAILTSIKSSRIEEFKALASALFPLAIAFRAGDSTSSIAAGIEGEAEKENIED